MTGVTIDLERATKALPTSYHQSPAHRWHGLRKRRSLVLILIFSTVAVLMLNAGYIPGAASSVQWMKDSMKPPAAPVVSDVANAIVGIPLPNDFGLGIAQEAAVKATSEPDSSSPPLLEEAHGSSDTLGVEAVGATSQADYRPDELEDMLLLIEALGNPDYEVPDAWQTQLMPQSTQAFAQTLVSVAKDAAAQDADMYRTQRQSWVRKHQLDHPLVVFSKSYCPYSKRAKELLRSLEARFVAIEVDLRPHDAHNLQAALAGISGHRTFPAIFMQGKLLGGCDKLEAMEKAKVLEGLLKDSGALS